MQLLSLERIKRLLNTSFSAHPVPSMNLPSNGGSRHPLKYCMFHTHKLGRALGVALA